VAVWLVEAVAHGRWAEARKEGEEVLGLGVSNGGRVGGGKSSLRRLRGQRHACGALRRQVARMVSTQQRWRRQGGQNGTEAVSEVINGQVSKLKCLVQHSSQGENGAWTRKRGQAVGIVAQLRRMKQASRQKRRGERRRKVRRADSRAGNSDEEEEAPPSEAREGLDHTGKKKKNLWRSVWRLEDFMPLRRVRKQWKKGKRLPKLAVERRRVGERQRRQRTPTDRSRSSREGRTFVVSGLRHVDTAVPSCALSRFSEMIRQHPQGTRLVCQGCRQPLAHQS